MQVNSIISLSQNTFTPHPLVYKLVNYGVSNPVIIAKKKKKSNFYNLEVSPNSFIHLSPSSNLCWGTTGSVKSTDLGSKSHQSFTFYPCNLKSWFHFQSLCFLTCNMDIMTAATVEWGGGHGLRLTPVSIAKEKLAVPFQKGNHWRWLCQFLSTSSFTPLLGRRGFISVVNLGEGSADAPWTSSSLLFRSAFLQRGLQGVCALPAHVVGKGWSCLTAPSNGLIHLYNSWRISKKASPSDEPSYTF